MIDYLKKELESKIEEREELYSKKKELDCQISVVEKNIKKLRWQIEECRPTIKIEIDERCIATWGDAWVRIDIDEGMIEVTRRNAAQVIERLQYFIREINDSPYYLARSFERENDEQIEYLKKDIELIKKTFEIEE